METVLFEGSPDAGHMCHVGWVGVDLRQHGLDFFRSEGFALLSCQGMFEAGPNFTVLNLHVPCDLSAGRLPSVNLCCLPATEGNWSE